MTANASKLSIGLTAILLLGACGNASDSGSAIGNGSASASPSETAAASDTPEPTPSPTEKLLEPSAYGSRATVLVDGLRVRLFPSLSADVTGRLDSGMEVSLREGPVGADGFRWLWVSYGSEIDARYPNDEAGWIAVDIFSASGGEIVSNPFIQEAAPVCPPRVNTELLAGLSEYAIGVCDVQVDTLHGLIDFCFEGPVSPFTYKPSWVHFSCPYLRSRETGENGWSLSLAFPPDVKQPKRGDVVTLHGRIGLDEARYGECTIEALDPEPEVVATLDRERQIWSEYCQTRFVVSDFVVEDHIDLPSMF